MNNIHEQFFFFFLYEQFFLYMQYNHKRHKTKVFYDFDVNF